jgi:NTE family protein
MDVPPGPPSNAARPALVLGGGGGLGIVQAAYVQAAFELGFRPSLIIGTSVGALNGAWVALHPEHAEGLLPIWRRLHRRRVLRSNPIQLAHNVLRRKGGIFANTIVSGLIREHLDGTAFEDTAIPLAVVATDLLEGRKHVFEHGKLAPAILASTAIPGCFEPVRINGRLYVDGGLTASVDLITALELGATEILAIDLAPFNEAGIPRTAAGVLRRSFGILSHATTDAMHRLVEERIPTRVLRPDLSRHSPWRIACDDTEIALSLREAREGMRAALDADGRVIPGGSSAPSEPASPVSDVPSPSRSKSRRPVIVPAV